MKYLLFLIILFGVKNGSLKAQVYDYRLVLDPGSDRTQLHVMLSGTTPGSSSDFGHGKWTAIEGIGSVDTVYKSVTGDSLVIIDVSGDTTWFEGGGGGGISAADTASMLSHYIERSDTANMLTHYIERADTAAMTSHHLERDANLVELTNQATARTNLGLGTLATQSGTFSGTSSGTNTGDQTSVSGNAGTATTLQTPRNINGISFNGSANISIPSPMIFTWDGQGGVVGTGNPIYFVIPITGTITGWSIVATGTSPTCTIDVWRIAAGTTLPTVSNTIMGTKPALATGNALRSSTLTSWSPTTVTAGEIWAASLDAVSAATWLRFTIEMN